MWGQLELQTARPIIKTEKEDEKEQTKYLVPKREPQAKHFQ